MNHPELQTLDLFHVTSAPFKKPDFDIARKKLAHEDGQPKGILGFWLSQDPGMCSSFGDWAAQIAIQPGARPVGMDCELLRQFHDAVDDEQTQTQDQLLTRYETLRERLKAHGDVLFILDARPAVGEVVVLNPQVLQPLDFKPMDANALRRPSQSIPKAWLDDESFRVGNAVVKTLMDEERSVKAHAFLQSARARSPAP